MAKTKRKKLHALCKPHEKRYCMSKITFRHADFRHTGYATVEASSTLPVRGLVEVPKTDRKTAIVVLYTTY